MKKVISLICVVAMIFALASCSSEVLESGSVSENAGLEKTPGDVVEPEASPEASSDESKSENDVVEPEASPEVSSDESKSENTEESMANTNNPIVEIEMENGKKIIVELYPKVAPKSVENFLKLVNEGFYDGLIFHRVIKDFMIQGGDPDGTGMGGPGTSVVGEFASNGHENNVKHEAGVLSMARSMDPNSAGSQFFIVTNQHASHLDGDYAAFGKVMDEESMKVVYEIEGVATGVNDKPAEDQVMKSVVVIG